MSQKPTRCWLLREDGRIEIRIAFPLQGYCRAKLRVLFAVAELEAFITELQEALIAACLEEPEE